MKSWDGVGNLCHAQDVVTAQLKSEAKREVIVYKTAGEPLGISIKGESALCRHSFFFLALPSCPGLIFSCAARHFELAGGRDHDLPILLSEIKEGGAVDRTKACFVGDEILEVNGIGIDQLEHNDAGSLLRATLNDPRVTLTLRFFPAGKL